MARRGHGEGSIYQRKDGRWAAALTLENHKRKTFYGETRKEVQHKLNAALHEQKQGVLATGPQQLLKNYLVQWLEQVYKPSVKPLSYQEHRSAVNKHLVPGLGHIPVQKLTAAKVQDFYNQKLKAGLAPRTIAFIHATLHSAMENAVKWGLVSRNVTKLVTLPHIDRYEAQTLTQEQAVKLLEVAQGSRIEMILIMAVTTGMRRGELLGLHWEDIDFDKKVVAVHRTVGWISGQGYKETEPKTKASRRRIVLPDVTLNALREQRGRQKSERERAGDRWHERGLVFTNKVGNYFDFDTLLKHLNDLLDKAGLPHMRFHDLRHSAATILMAAGVHPKVVQERLGHSTIAMTMDIYSHVLPSMQREAADKIDDMFNRT